MSTYERKMSNKLKPFPFINNEPDCDYEHEIKDEKLLLNGNNSLFVSGAIPSLLWMLVIIMFFDFIMAPLISGIFNITINIVNIPEWYPSMCGTIILGLLAKKAYDSTDLSYGSFIKKSKRKSEIEAIICDNKKDGATKSKKRNTDANSVNLNETGT